LQEIKRGLADEIITTDNGLFRTLRHENLELLPL
jgi:hypothetical protein